MSEWGTKTKRGLGREANLRFCFHGEVSLGFLPDRMLVDSR